MAGASDSSIFCVAPHDAERAWPLVSGIIDAAHVSTDHFPPDTLAFLKSGQLLLWIATDKGNKVIAAMTTSLEQRVSGKICRIVVASGKGSGIQFWKDHISKIEAYARAQGCAKVVVDGRRGWERVLTGYVPKAVSLELTL